MITDKGICNDIITFEHKTDGSQGIKTSYEVFYCTKPRGHLGVHAAVSDEMTGQLQLV